MNIYIDESGSFVNAPSEGAWNTVVAYAIPESDRRKLDECIARLRCQYPDCKLEVKLRDIDESAYFRFLCELGRLEGIAFCVATDAGLNDKAAVLRHQDMQVRKMLVHVDKMHFESGRQSLISLSEQMKNLPIQLYVQLVCQVELLHDVVCRSSLYFVQRRPSSLREFRWRIDQKDIIRTEYEKAFEIVCPPLLQTKSFSEPLIALKEYDYSCMKQYEFKDGEFPDYLNTEYGLNVDVRDGFNIQKIIRGNFHFVDSRRASGVQAADLLASGFRRLLRRGFMNNELAAKLLGKLTVQAIYNHPPLRLVSLSKDSPVGTETARLIRIMASNSRVMLTPS